MPPPLLTPGFRRSELSGASAVSVPGYGCGPGGVGIPGGYVCGLAFYVSEVPPAPGLPTVYYPAGTVVCGVR